MTGRRPPDDDRVAREHRRGGDQILQCGAGIRGNHWAQFIREHPDVECVGVVDIDPAALDKVKAKVQSESAGTSATSMRRSRRRARTRR